MAEYAAVFFQRVVKNEYSEDDAVNAKEAGKAFVGAPLRQKEAPWTGVIAGLDLHVSVLLRLGLAATQCCMHLLQCRPKAATTRRVGQRLSLC